MSLRGGYEITDVAIQGKCCHSEFISESSKSISIILFTLYLKTLKLVQGDMRYVQPAHFSNAVILTLTARDDMH